MDTRTGVVAARSVLEQAMTPDERRQFLRPVVESALSREHLDELRRTGRTMISPRSRCPCGSGHRFKRCCMVPRG